MNKVFHLRTNYNHCQTIRLTLVFQALEAGEVSSTVGKRDEQDSVSCRTAGRAIRHSEGRADRRRSPREPPQRNGARSPSRLRPAPAPGSRRRTTERPRGRRPARPDPLDATRQVVGRHMKSEERGQGDRLGVAHFKPQAFVTQIDQRGEDAVDGRLERHSLAWRSPCRVVGRQHRRDRCQERLCSSGGVRYAARSRSASFCSTRSGSPIRIDLVVSPLPRPQMARCRPL